MWQTHYAQLGLGGVEDEQRPGRPWMDDHDDVLLLVGRAVPCGVGELTD
jgi:hypothetical protein